MKPLMLPIHFFSETNTFATLESYHTVKDLKLTMMKKLQFNLQRMPYYSLYEVCNKKDIVEERFLDDNDKIVDMIAVWDKEKEEFYKRNESIEFKLYLKLQLYYNYAETDIDTITMIYVQTAYEVNLGRFNLNEEKIISLAAIQLLANYGSNQDLVYQNLQAITEKFIPFDKFALYPAVDWIQKIMESFSNTKPCSKLEAKINYLESLNTSPEFQSHQFIVKVIFILKKKYSQKLNANNAEKSYPEDCILAVKSKGISVLDMDRVKFNLIF